MIKIYSLFAALIMSAFQPVMAAVSYSCQVLNSVNKGSQILSKVIVKSDSVTVVSSQSGTSDIQITTSSGKLEANDSNAKFFGKNQDSILQVQIVNGKGQIQIDQEIYKIDCN